MYKISRQILSPENLRKIIAKYNSSISKSKKPDYSKNSKKHPKNKYKSKLFQAPAVNVVMEASKINSLNKSDDNSKKNSVKSENARRFPLAYSKYRRWENTTGGEIYYNSPQKEEGVEFTLVSYNILAQDLLEGHNYLYYNHKRDALCWSHRLARLTDEILSLKPHIICLQEVQSDHLDSLKLNLKDLKLQCIYKKKTGNRTDGCAIFYNEDKFKLKDYTSIEFYQPNVEKLDKENVGLVLKLSAKDNPEDYFLVATTHLLYNPRRQDLRLAQIQVLLAELDQLSFKEFCKDNLSKRFPIILTGDFNLKPYSAPYKLLTSGELKYSNLTRLGLERSFSENEALVGKIFLPPHLGITDACQHIDVIAYKYTKRSRLYNSESSESVDVIFPDLVEMCSHLFSSGQLTHGLNLKSAYHHSNKQEEKYASTYQNEWITVDYIFYSKEYNNELESFRDSNLKLLSRYVLPTASQCVKMDMIPNQRLGSDHLALAVNFFLKSEKKNS